MGHDIRGYRGLVKGRTVGKLSDTVGRLKGRPPRRAGRVAALAACLCLALMAGTGSAAMAGGLSRPSLSFGRLPLSFERVPAARPGQVAYQAHGPGYGLLLKPRGASLVVGGGCRLDLSLVGADAHASLVGEAPLPGKVSYLLGKDPRGWRCGLSTYFRVRSRGVYPGTDLLYYGRLGHLEYDFVLAPGASPDRIRLKVRGARSLSITPQGDLVLRTGAGDVRQLKPRVYQQAAGVRREMRGSYVLHGADEVGFQVARYDRTRPLVIDPVLTYSTYLGGTKSDNVSAVAVDASGCAYLAGGTQSAGLPGHVGGTTQDSVDAFVTKLNPSGSAALYTVYLGGSKMDSARALAVDSNGAAYVAGFTQSPDLPTTEAVQSTFGSTVTAGSPMIPSDAFVAKVSPNGAALDYCTYLGGTASDLASGIAVDATGSACVVGMTSSPNFPVVAALQGTLHGASDAFVAKLNPTGSALVFSTYLGGSGSDGANAVAVGAGGSLYVCGYTESTDFPTQAPFQPAAGGGEDAFVCKLNATGSALSYSTYLGGTKDEEGYGIGVDSTGAAIVAGFTDSPNFPTHAPLQPSLAGGSDVFILKLNAAGSALAYSTYLGGSGGDYAMGMAVGTSGDVTVVGSTSSTDFPTLDPLQSLRGSIDGFVSRLDASGASLAFSTYLGGSGFDTAVAVAADSSGNAYVGGQTNSSDFPVASAMGASLAGLEDGFITKLSPSPPELSASPTSAPNDARATITFTSHKGKHIATGATVKLSLAGQPDITAGKVTVAADGLSATAEFDLTGSPPGRRDVTITNPDGTTLGQARAFEVLQAYALLVEPPIAESGQGSVPITVREAHGAAIFGDAFRVKLSQGEGADSAETSATPSANGTSLTATLNLTWTAAGTWDLVIQKMGGGANLTLSKGFVVTPVGAQRLKVTPSSTSQAAPVTVTLSEVHGQTPFEPGTTVSLVRAGETGIPGTSVSAAGDHATLTATFDLTGKTVGSWDVVVTLPDGTTITQPRGFSLSTLAVLDSVQPRVGRDSAVVTLTVRGSGLSAGSTLKLQRGGDAPIPGTVPTFSADETTATASFDLRSRSLGAWDLTVTDSLGNGASAQRAFTIGHPTLTVSPLVAANDAPVQVTLHEVQGIPFEAGSTVKLSLPGGPEVAGTGVVIPTSGDALTAAFDLTGKPAGAWNLVLTYPDGATATVPLVVEKPLPALLVTPTVGYTGYPVMLVIYDQRAKHLFDATSVARLSRTGEADVVGTGTAARADGLTLTATFDLASRAPGVYDLTVTRGDGTTTSLEKAFTLRKPVSISQWSPHVARDRVPVKLSVKGTGLASDCALQLLRGSLVLSPVAAPTCSADESTMEATFDLRGRPLGSYTIRVMDPYGNSATWSDAFALCEPLIDASPAAVMNLGPQTVTLNEEHGLPFEPGTTVRLARTGQADIPGTNLTSGADGRSATVTFDLTGREPGNWSLVVTYPDGATGITSFTLGSAWVRPAERILYAVAVQSLWLQTPQQPGLRLSNVQVSLAQGATVVPAASVVPIGAGQGLKAVFDLRNQPRGDYDVRLTYPDGHTQVLLSAVSVMDPQITLAWPWNSVLPMPTDLTLQSYPGVAFTPGCTIRLSRMGQPDLPITGVAVREDGGAITGRVDLSQATSGTYDVTVTDPAGHAMTANGPLYTRDPQPVLSTRRAANLEVARLVISDVSGLPAFPENVSVALTREGHAPIPGTAL
ncbi:MAG TPA: SBBP repeat-containing protein, partial [Armatimonadota bacterium]